MHALRLFIPAGLIAGLSSAACAQVVPGPGYMVWQQGINGSAEWQRLGCPRDYASDAEKEEMIRGGECRNARPAVAEPASTNHGGMPHVHTVSAQSMPVWDWVGPYAMANLNREVLDRRLEDERGAEPSDETEGTVATTSALLTYSPSAERRRTNLANFANKTRRSNPESAAAMDAMSADTGVIQQIGAALSPYGYSVANVGDAYAAWWMLSWKAANGDTSDPSPGQFKAVQAQAHRALAGSSQMRGANDAQKQEMAEALLMHAAMVEALNGMTAEQPELKARVQQSVRQGANASGLNLDAMRLTDNGFVSR